jgi:MYXO-CTERM domain-containing protein
MKSGWRLLLVAALFATSGAIPARAHFTLKKPASWLKEDGVGGPQKGGPCGVGGPDNVDPAPTTAAITTFEVGQTIDVEWVETVPHPGHFRIALAEDRNDLKDPDLQIDGSCNYDESTLPTGAHDNVLADGLFLRSTTSKIEAAGKTFSTQVTLPDKPCEKCTLQVLQFMEKHPPKCIYYHCADLRIVSKGSGAPAADGGSDAGATRPADAGTSPRVAAAGSGGKASAGTGSTNPASKAKSSGGCAVQAGPGRAGSVPWLVLGIVFAVSRRRSRNRKLS